jgi:phosphoribosylamine--glycine ligase
MREIVTPVVQGMRAEGIPYRGFLYAGLMLTCDGPRVIEFNVRFGDPEAQVVMPLIADDLLPSLIAASDGSLPPAPIALRDRVAVGVVLASEGYPGSVPSGRVIRGLDEAEQLGDVAVFHAGTALENSAVITAGGRVVTVVATAPDYAAAIARVYEAAGRISFEGMQFRRDIGAKALRRVNA